MQGPATNCAFHICSTPVTSSPNLSRFLKISTINIFVHPRTCQMKTVRRIRLRLIKVLLNSHNISRNANSKSTPENVTHNSSPSLEKRRSPRSSTTNETIDTVGMRPPRSLWASCLFRSRVHVFLEALFGAGSTDLADDRVLLVGAVDEPARGSR